jgi:hypothetical protein
MVMFIRAEDRPPAFRLADDGFRFFGETGCGVVVCPHFQMVSVLFWCEFKEKTFLPKYPKNQLFTNSV